MARPTGRSWIPGLADEGTGPQTPGGPRSAAETTAPAAAEAPEAPASETSDAAADGLDHDGWNRMQHLADTVTRDELLDVVRRYAPAA